MGDLVMADWVMVATELVMEVCNLLKLVSFYFLLEQNASNQKGYGLGGYGGYGGYGKTNIFQMPKILYWD